MKDNDTAPYFSLYAKLLFGERAGLRQARTVQLPPAYSANAADSGEMPACADPVAGPATYSKNRRPRNGW